MLKLAQIKTLALILALPLTQTLTLTLAKALTLPKRSWPIVITISERRT